MVATPNTALTATLGTEAAFAGHITDDVITEMWAKLSPTAKMFFAKEEYYMNKFSQENGGKVATEANGYQAKIIKKSTASGIERYYDSEKMSTPANTSLASAGAVDIDQAPTANNVRVLTGDYGVSYGYCNRELWHKVRGGKGGEMRNNMSQHFVNELAQTMSEHINENMFADGTLNTQDGFEHWVKQTGTKWNSEDIAVHTELQGRLENTYTSATWTVANIRRIIRRTQQGLIGSSISSGMKPDFCVCNSAMVDKLKDALDDKQIINQGPGRDQHAGRFPYLGVLDDYVITDGVVFFADYYLDANLGGNWGIGYMGYSGDFEIICHQDYMFTDFDAMKDKKNVNANWESLPNRLDRDVFKFIFLWNMYHKRPRNFTKIVLAT